ncbi:MAG: tRNA (adenosine(37)-N6)-threonylcarbamoyltransferase complex dimerization subunit type 1 TsaB [Anaerolineaceae bacterium]|nr:tRNA (adenosine(37)-N6)-threonylcarbamoyltransferase complex dimerization subunit type 1 TsaB [Anaerolineaceae bacterium]
MLLAVDTSTKMIGLALMDGQQIIAQSSWYSKNHHTVELSPAIERILQQCDISAEDLSCLAVALGPGSFTGLRIGLAVVKGLSLALGIPVIGVPTLEIYTHAQKPEGDLQLATLLQAGRSKYAFQWYQAERKGWKATSEIFVLASDEICEILQQPCIVCGELTTEDRELIRSECKQTHLVSAAASYRYPTYLAEIAYKRWKKGERCDVNDLAPIYLQIAGSVPTL